MCGLRSEDADTQRKAAEHQGQQARVEASNANQTLGLVLNVLPEAKINPKAGQPYTVPEALANLASNLDGAAHVPPKADARGGY